MPKDLIHFKIAERTARNLDDTRLSSMLDAEPFGLLLGSVFHDALFYAATPSGWPLEKLAHAFHGSDGQDTFTLLRLQAKHARTTGSPMSIAILIGMASHIFADATMHPMVWHFSGDYYANDPARKNRVRQRHRSLESLMDMTACPEMLHRSRYALRVMLRRTGNTFFDALPIAAIGKLADMPESKARSRLKTAWRIFATFQSLYPITPLAKTLHRLMPWLPRHAAEIASLFYAPQLLRQKDRLTGDISFVHPVTGENQSANLEDLMDVAADRAARFCRAMEPALFGDAPLTLSETGPSLDTGLPATDTKKMTHYSETPFPDLP